MEQQSLRLMQALRRRGHHISLLSLHSLGALSSQLDAADIPAVGLAYGKSSLWCVIVRLRRAIRRESPDALLLTGHSLLVLIAVLGFCRGHRLLTIHFHHTGVKPRWFWRLYYGLACQLCNSITFPSDFVRCEAESLFPPMAGKAQTVRYPITIPKPFTTQERQNSRSRFGLSPDVTIIGNAGWLISRKRFDVFLNTAARIHLLMPNSRFLIVGDGPERPRLEALAVELGIADVVVWAGWTVNMREFYASIDLLLFNSDWDAMGLTPIEAITHGIPVVSSVLHGGLAEVLRPGVDAVVLDQHDVSMLSQSVLQLLADPSRSATMVYKARDQLQGLCDPEQLAAWHEVALTSAVNQ
jgi:glycosyltransferase involved in cell wall biosynthesis